MFFNKGEMTHQDYGYCKEHHMYHNDTFWKDEWKGLIEFIRWDCLLFYAVALFIFTAAFGWKGLIPFFLIIWVYTLGGGSWIDMNDYPREEPKTKCVAGKIDCKICDNGRIHFL